MFPDSDKEIDYPYQSVPHFQKVTQRAENIATKEQSDEEQENENPAIEMENNDDLHHVPSQDYEEVEELIDEQLDPEAGVSRITEYNNLHGIDDQQHGRQRSAEDEVESQNEESYSQEPPRKSRKTASSMFRDEMLMEIKRANQKAEEQSERAYQLQGTK